MNLQPSLMSQITNQMATGGSPMNVQTPGSPGFQPSLQPPATTPMPNQSPTSMMHLHGAFQRRGLPIPQQIQQAQPQAPTAQPQVTLPGQIQDTNPAQPGTQIPLSEAELIIKAMSKHLDHKNKMEAKILESALEKPQFNGASPSNPTGYTPSETLQSHVENQSQMNL